MEPPIYEVYVILHPVSARLAELVASLEPLVSPDVPHLHDLDLRYRPSADTALIAFHYDERALTGEVLRRLDDIARGAGVRIVDPARLGGDERRAFFEVRLPQFTLIARGLPTLRDAVAALARHLGTIPPPFARATPREGVARLGAPPAETVAARPRERMVVTIPPPPPPLAVSMPRPPTLPPAPGDSQPVVMGRLPLERGTRPGPLALSVEERDRATRGLGVTPRDEVRRRAAAPTAPLQPRRAGSEPPDVIVDAGAIEEPPPTSLDIRFLRGCDWVPARVRALSVRGAYVVTSAPPRLGDAVHVSIGFAGKTALVRGTVYHVTSAEDALSTGASGFAVRFPEYACPPRQRLIEVLLAARHAGVTVRPPPNRTSVRFPVRWPVQLAGAMAAFRAAAHDVSSGGFFIATERAIDVGTEVQFAVPLDVNEVPVEGRARVARIQGSEVAARGIPGGVGMQIVAMDGVHRAAWDQFLGRVRRRSEKRILVGATPERLDSLVTGLGSAGYAVTAGSDPGVLMRLAELDPNPPDAAVIDVELEQRHAASGWLEQVFAARQVQCLTVQGDVIKARAMVDELLLVDQP